MLRMPGLKYLCRLVMTALLSLSLVITPQMVWAANVLLVTSLKEFETDLGNAILKVDGIDSHMQLGVTPKGELTVTQFAARQVTLRFKPAAEVPASTSNTGKKALPQHIHIPLPFHLLLGQIERLTIIQGEETTQFTHIQFDLDAESDAMQFRIGNADSLWGKINTHFQMQNKAPFPLGGWIKVRQPLGSLPYDLRADLTGDLTRVNLTANHHYQPQTRPFAIVPANQQNTDMVELSASIGLDEHRTSHFQFHLKQLQARHIHPQLAGQMDLNIVANGNLTAQGQIMVKVDAGNSHLQTQPLVISGQAALQGGQLMQLDLLAQLDKNTLKVNTTPSSQPGETRLAWQAGLHDLAQLMPGFSGQIKGNGDIVQLNEGFTARYQLSGQQLQLPQALSLTRVEAHGQASSLAQSSIENHITLKGLSQQDTQGIDSPPIDAELNLSGTLAQHQLTLNIRDAEPTLHRNLLLALNGSWQNTLWQGQLTQLQDADAKLFQLAKPASMRWQSNAGFQLQDLDLRAGDGQLQLSQWRYRPAIPANPLTQQASEKVQLQTQGSLNNFPIQALIHWFIPAQTDLLPTGHFRLSAQWDWTLDSQLNGNLHLQRNAGDWQVYDPSKNAWQGLGIQTLLTDISAHNNRLSIQSSIQSNGALDLQFSANTVVTPTFNGVVIEKAAPVTAQLKANLPQLGWLNKLIPDMQPSGQLSVTARANGTLARPQLQGELQGAALVFQIPSQGVWLEQGQVHATMADDQVRFDQIHFAGKTGELNARATLKLQPESWQLDGTMQLNNLQALSRVDRWVQLSGDTQLSMTSQQTAISGNLRIHKGLFELPKADKPALDEDVVIESPQTSQTTASSTLLFRDFVLDFGNKPLILPFKESEQFMLRGQGLNGALSGKMQLNGMLNELTAAGTLEITGTYLAYGQSLTIETGRLIFSGKLPNIGLDILATRQVESTKVGIQINGSLQTPQLKLVSTPETSNENKVSLLVLGQPMSQVGSNDMALLSVAAGALLSQGDSVSLQTKIAQAVGLDSIDVRGTGPTNYAVSVGKRINRNLVIGYEKSIVGLLNVGKLTYQLTKRISIETRTGSDNALDVFYGFSFD
jgi:translocation and assembly module TamB